jgi:hypothetical protein
MFQFKRLKLYHFNFTKKTMTKKARISEKCTLLTLVIIKQTYIYYSFVQLILKKKKMQFKILILHNLHTKRIIF